jgi:hypothetical protein
VDLTDPTLLKVLRKLNGLGRPACRVYGRNDCFLIRPMAVFGHVHLVHVGPVTRLDRDASAEAVGDAALSALAAYAEFPDRPPPDDTGIDPLLKAAGVKSSRGFTLGSAMLSVERAGKRIAIVPYNSESFGAQIRREPSQASCSPQAKSVGERIKSLMERQERHNHELRKNEREHRDPAVRGVLPTRRKKPRAPGRRKK